MAISRRDLVHLEIKNVKGLIGGESKGSGAYGAVYEVTVDGVTRIAKRLHDILLTSDVRPSEKQGIRERFYHECLLLSKLNHPNVVEFVGVHFERVHRTDVALIMESLHTDLEHFLDVEEHPNIPISVKLSILLDVSSGLLYLHDQLEEPLIHRDLTTGNILLTKDIRAKIADLGVSKLLKNYPQGTSIQTKCPGTLAYMPPEALRENPQYGKALDVFSFGQLTLYIVNQEFPEVFDASHDSTMTTALKKGELQILKRKKWIDMLPKDHCLRDTVLHCLQDKPEKRPSIEELSSSMKTLCVQYPKSLEEVISEWGDKTEVGRL